MTSPTTWPTGRIAKGHIRSVEMVKRSGVGFLALAVSLAWTLSAAAQTTEKSADKADKQDVRLLQVGHIVKIDQKKRTITIENPEESEEQPSQPLGQLGRRGQLGRPGAR